MSKIECLIAHIQKKLWFQLLFSLIRACLCQKGVNLNNWALMHNFTLCVNQGNSKKEIQHHKKYFEIMSKLHVFTTGKQFVRVKSVCETRVWCFHAVWCYSLWEDHQNKLSVVPVLVSSDPLGFCRVVLSEISLLRKQGRHFLTPSASFTHIWATR